MARRFAATLHHTLTLVRVWATTELTLWWNRFHVVFALMITMMFIGLCLSHQFNWPSVCVMLAADGSLAFRISVWNHDRLPLHH
jgi:hypothetical protein